MKAVVPILMANSRNPSLVHFIGMLPEREEGRICICESIQ
jgi:hypothetical protein